MPAAGDPAPPAENPLVGSDSRPEAIDSRADAEGVVPDPELHATTVASALEEQKPIVVAVSTPVYCVSRFCGPITETLGTVAGLYRGNVEFIHIEVWNNFEERALAKSAADWIYRDGVEDPSEPWVFLVGADGRVAQRWDNVVSEAQLLEAIDNELS